MSNLIEFEIEQRENEPYLAEEIVLCNNSTFILELAKILLHPVGRKVLSSSVKGIQKAFGEEISKERNDETCPFKNHLRLLFDDEDLVEYVYAMVKFPKFKDEQVRDFNDYFRKRVKEASG